MLAVYSVSSSTIISCSNSSPPSFAASFFTLVSRFFFPFPSSFHWHCWFIIWYVFSLSNTIVFWFFFFAGSRSIRFPICLDSVSRRKSYCFCFRFEIFRFSSSLLLFFLRWLWCVGWSTVRSSRFLVSRCLFDQSAEPGPNVVAEPDEVLILADSLLG